MMAAESSGASEKSSQPSSGGKGWAGRFSRMVKLLLAIGMTTIIIVIAYFIQSAQAVCGDKFVSDTATLVDRLKCPSEKNRFRLISATGNVLLNSVHFNVDGQRGWAVGGNGVIIATRDGGQSWQIQGSNVNSTLMSVYFNSDDKRGLAVGKDGTILVTRDGGQVWQQQRLGKAPFQFFSVQSSTDGQRSWVVGSGGRIFAMADDELPWQLRHTDVENDLKSIHFSADDQRGWAVGTDGTIIKTNDGGRTWQKQTSALKRDLTSVYFDKDDMNGWIVGQQGSKRVVSTVWSI